MIDNTHQNTQDKLSIVLTRSELALIVTALYLAEDHPGAYDEMARVVLTSQQRAATMLRSLIAPLREKLNHIDEVYHCPNIAIMVDRTHPHGHISKILGPSHGYVWLIDQELYQNSLNQINPTQELLRAFNQYINQPKSTSNNPLTGAGAPSIDQKMPVENTPSHSTQDLTMDLNPISLATAKPRSAKHQKSTQPNTPEPKKTTTSFIIRQIPIDHGQSWRQFLAGLSLYKRLS